ncbi:acyl-CoA thioesterase [Saccharopolyspora mangrovi]|uniref:Thioesterase family protein n=1 Tax=Saccharopolyspora mangrovi TaxID=3082379 RepID=A0ABU6AGS9_9PSEU|nr:thioesterase family protein [Saccharopolyspora sp. S2-29]MEB3370530.1 thioesterase family protein [Saccharopolyspora sp. S2-29]
MRVHSHRVRYHEVDLQGYLFNARYLEIADVAMAEYFRSLGWTYQELNRAGMDPSVVSANLRFASPARFDDVLDVVARCNRVGNSSFDLEFTISSGSREIATAELAYVNVDAAQARARPIPPSVRTAMTDEQGERP